MTGDDRAFAAAIAACPFVNHGAVRRILAAAAPHLEANERERIVELAKQHDAWGKCWHPEPRANDWTEVPFADLIREEVPGG